MKPSKIKALSTYVFYVTIAIMRAQLLTFQMASLAKIGVIELLLSFVERK